MTLTPPDVSRPERDAAIVLPPSGDGQRRRRRHERQRVTRQRWLAGVAVIVAVVAAVALLKGSRNASNVRTTATTQAALVPAAGGSGGSTRSAGAGGPTPAALSSVVVQLVENGTPVAVAALLPAPTGGGGTVLVFPPSTPTTTIDAALPHGRPQATVALGDNDLVNLFKPAGPLQVAVPGVAGTLTVAPADAPRFFTVGGTATPLAHQQAYWNTWLVHVREVPSSVPSNAEVRSAVTVIVLGQWQVAVQPGDGG